MYYRHLDIPPGGRGLTRGKKPHTPPRKLNARVRTFPHFLSPFCPICRALFALHSNPCSRHRGQSPVKIHQRRQNQIINPTRRGRRRSKIERWLRSAQNLLRSQIVISRWHHQIHDHRPNRQITHENGPEYRENHEKLPELHGSTTFFGAILKVSSKTISNSSSSLAISVSNHL